MGLNAIIFSSVIHLVISFFVGAIARDKGRSFALWFLFGLLTPIWGLFYVVLSDSLKKELPFRTPFSPDPPILGQTRQKKAIPPNPKAGKVGNLR